MKNVTTVLYVDDNPKSSRLLSSVLEDCGFRILAKDDPAEALDLCKRTYFDIALLDYEMPKMKGSELAREIKAIVPEVPVVLLSAQHSLPDDELRFVDAHFGFGTVLDDLVWAMRILGEPKWVVAHHRISQAMLHPAATHFSNKQRGALLNASKWQDST